MNPTNAKHTAGARENRYVENCYGLVSDCPLMAAPDGFRMRVPRSETADYIAMGWTRFAELTNAKNPDNLALVNPLARAQS